MPHPLSLLSFLFSFSPNREAMAPKETSTHTSEASQEKITRLTLVMGQRPLDFLLTGGAVCHTLVPGPLLRLDCRTTAMWYGVPSFAMLTS